MKIEPRHYDDYYWQHQSDLQQSDVSFEAMLKDERVPTTSRSDKASEIDRPTSTQPTVVSAQAEIHSSDCIDAPCSMVSRLRADDGIVSDMVPRLRGDDSMNNLITKTSNEHSSKSITKTNPINLTLLRQASLIKNYQLFVNDQQQVELTLNTRHLSDQQSIDLQKHIQLWLVHKGYSLKQLIINGIQQ